jgi:4-hydroxy-3-polyprenylbenzoate decarboxylase
LFENLKGYPGQKLLINQFGSARRMNMALEVDSLDDVADRIRGFIDVKSPQGFLDKIKMLPMLAEMGKFFPKTVSPPARAKKSSSAITSRCLISPSSNAGQKMEGASLLFPA